MYIYLFESLFSVLLGRFLGMELLGLREILFNFLKAPQPLLRDPQLLEMRLLPPPSMHVTYTLLFWFLLPARPEGHGFLGSQI